MKRRPILAILALAVLAAVVAFPALAAESEPGGPGNSGKPKKEKVPKDPITLSGTVESSTDADGRTTYTLRSGGTTYTLDAGPSWFLGDDHPLNNHVGDSVTIVGEKAADSTEVDVTSINGTAVRAEGGKPPWAGGWKKVGEGHPGWSQEKADRFKAKFGDCFPPGQCKEKPNKPSKGDPESTEGTNPD